MNKQISTGRRYKVNYHTFLSATKIKNGYECKWIYATFSGAPFFIDSLSAVRQLVARNLDQKWRKEPIVYMN